MDRQLFLPECERRIVLEYWAVHPEALLPNAIGKRGAPCGPVSGDLSEEGRLLVEQIRITGDA